MTRQEIVHEYTFEERLRISRGQHERTDLDLLKTWLDGCVEVIKTNEKQDRKGVDYIAVLRKGGKLLIDAKTRETRRGGIARYWKQGPDLALERWSVVPTERGGGKVGWTLCESKQVDYILFTYDPVDSNEAFLLPFQLLRMAYRRNLREWHHLYRVQKQSTRCPKTGRHLWWSECVFVPATVVIEAINQASRTVIQAIECALDRHEAEAYQLMFPPLFLPPSLSE